MFRRILVPLDGTRFGEYALPYAISIAARTGAWLELAHVHRRVAFDGSLTGLPQYQYQHVTDAETREDDAALVAEEDALAARVEDIGARFGVHATARVLHGATARALAQEARHIDADLIVMSTHARTGLARLRHGDLAHELVHRLDVPAMCVRPIEGQDLAAHRIERIVVPVDGSEFSEQILYMATRLAGALDARIVLLHVVSPRPLAVTGLDDLQRTIPHRGEAMEYLRILARRIPRDMPEPELIAVEAADAAVAIAATLSEWPHDVLTIATHGRDGLSRYVLGSTAERVLRMTDRPVLLYKPRPARRPKVDVPHFIPV